MLKSELGKKVLLGSLIFLVSCLAYYYPVHKKGFPPGGELSEARNFAVAGTLNTESNNGLLLSSKDIVAEGKNTASINVLTPIIYGEIFKFTGTSFSVLKNLPVFLAITLNALINVLIFLLIAEFFGIEVGFVGALVFALLPVRALWGMLFGTYEWGLLLFIIGLWIFLNKKSAPFKATVPRLIFASVFLSLAALSRDALALSFVPIVLFDFYKERSWKRSLALGLPFLLIFGSTLTTHTWLPTQNGYLASDNTQSFYNIAGEVYPDPYTYFYNRDAYTQSLLSKGTLGSTYEHFFKQWGYHVTLIDRLNAYRETAFFYIQNTLSFTILGGPLILLLMFLGGLWLKQKDKDFFRFIVVWLIFWLGYLVFIESTTDVDHFLEIAFPLALLVGLGGKYLFDLINPEKRTLWVGIFLIFVVGHLAYANFWSLFDVYQASHTDLVTKYIESPESGSMPETVAVGNGLLTNFYHYYTDKTVIYFDPNTVADLLKQGKLNEAFNTYGVKSAIGYPEPLSSQIKSTTNIKTLTLEP